MILFILNLRNQYPFCLVAHHAEYQLTVAHRLNP
jgi:hypothetical protein